ncbi:hypothetical protein KA005_01620 [bacterium]|nr:hypothetical protein [bacterium]
MYDPDIAINDQYEEIQRLKAELAAHKENEGDECPLCLLEAEVEAIGSVMLDLQQDCIVLAGFVAIILCWKPEWAQTSYFKKLPEKMKNDLVELAKSTKQEGSGGVDNEWLALLTKEEK